MFVWKFELFDFVVSLLIFLLEIRINVYLGFKVLNVYMFGGKFLELIVGYCF